MNEIVFTPVAVLDLLRQIDELSEFDIEMVESLKGDIQLRVGESLYNIETDDTDEVPVPDSAIEDIKQINEDEYEDIFDEIEDVYETGTISSGVIKEVAKTLLVGGLVRLTSKLLRK